MWAPRFWAKAFWAGRFWPPLASGNVSFTVFGSEITSSAATYKVLGQVATPPTALQDIYTAPASTQVVVSTICICNRSASAITYRFSVAIAGAVDDNKQYVTYDYSLPANATDFWTGGFTLGPADIIRVRTSA